MSFGDREDELWEAMKPSFKPRLVTDPNIKYAQHLVNQTGPFATSGALTSLGRPDVRATLARFVRRAPEGRFKVTGREKRWCVCRVGKVCGSRIAASCVTDH